MLLNIAPLPNYGLIGHRGLAKIAKENTWESIEAAISYGLNWIELDLQLTQDNSIIVLHDETIEFKAKQLAVCDLNDAALKFFEPLFFSDLVNHLSTLKIQYPLCFNLELKIPKLADQNYRIALIQQLAKFWKKLTEELNLKIVLSSFDWKVLSMVQQTIPSARVSYLTNSHGAQLVQDLHLIHEQNPISANLNHENITQDIIDLCKSLQLPILAFTINDPDIAIELLNLGVAGVFTDHPLHEQDQRFGQRQQVV